MRRAITIATWGLLLAAGIFGAGLSGRASAQNLDHYQCYELEPQQMQGIDVRLIDQFGETQNSVVEPKYLCTPVDKNGSGIKDKEGHLLCYLLKEIFLPTCRWR
jgi:hypothetical protein